MTDKYLYEKRASQTALILALGVVLMAMSGYFLLMVVHAYLAGPKPLRSGGDPTNMLVGIGAFCLFFFFLSLIGMFKRLTQIKGVRVVPEHGLRLVHRFATEEPLAWNEIRSYRMELKKVRIGSFLGPRLDMSFIELRTNLGRKIKLVALDRLEDLYRHIEQNTAAQRFSNR